MPGLSGKVAWITGAGSGIGEAAALALAGEGAAVALTGRRREPLQAVANEITKTGGKALVVPADLGEQEASNLNSAFYCSVAALGVMRPQKDGLLIHTSSWAGRFAGIVPGPAYVAAKHAVVAMSYTINMEEFQHGIRSTVLCPNEVATPILDLRPTPVSAEDRARMIQPEHMADLIVYVAKQPPSICVNEIVISPTWNRGYAHLAGLGPKR